MRVAPVKAVVTYSPKTSLMSPSGDSFGTEGHCPNQNLSQPTPVSPTCEVVERDVIEIARRELGESGGGKYLENETWCWGQQVQEDVKTKKEAFKNWRTSSSEVDSQAGIFNLWKNRGQTLERSIWRKVTKYYILVKNQWVHGLSKSRVSSQNGGTIYRVAI